MKRRRFTASTVMLGLLVTSCATSNSASDDTAADSTGLVGVAMPTTTSDRWIADGDNLRAQLTDLGYDVDLQYAEDDVPTQQRQLEEMIEAGAEVLIIGSIDGSQLSSQLAGAAAAGIPVIAYDRLIRDSGDVAYYATFDNWRVGVQQATSLLEGLGVTGSGGSDEYVIELIGGSADDNNAVMFFEGAMSVLQPYIDDGVLHVESGETDFETVATEQWNGDVAAERIQRILSEYDATTVLDGVLSPYDGISRAVLEVTAQFGYGTDDRPLPVITGQDAELGSAKSIAAGEQYSTIYKDTRQLAEVTVLMAVALLEDREPETNDVTTYDNGVITVPTYLLQVQEVTAQNYTEILVDSGYYTAAEIGTGS